MLSGQEGGWPGGPGRRPGAYAPAQLSWLRLIGRFIRHKPLGMFGVGVVLVMSLAAGAAPWLSRYDAEENFYVANPAYAPGTFEPEQKLYARTGPSLRHWFGTDQFGRDNYARVVWGARRSLGVALGALLFAIIFGTSIGIVSGYYRGWLDMLLQRLMDSIQAFPAMFILLLAGGPHREQPRDAVHGPGICGPGERATNNPERRPHRPGGAARGGGARHRLQSRAADGGPHTA